MKEEKWLKSTTRLWIIGIVIVCALWIGSIIFFIYVLPGMKWEDRAFIGDTFGAVNALFAGLAFVAVVITLYLQSQTIKDTKEEQEQQSFENKFFQLLKIHNDIIAGIEQNLLTGFGNSPIRGRQRFRAMYDDFIKEVNGDYNFKAAKDPMQIILIDFEKLFKYNEHDLAHYFRHVYHIIAFINRSSIGDDKKWEYVKLFRAQLSSHELLLIFYNCIWYKEGKGKFKTLSEKFALFEYMPKLEHQDHCKFFESTAFAEEKAVKKFFPNLNSNK